MIFYRNSPKINLNIGSFVNLRFFFKSRRTVRVLYLIQCEHIMCYNKHPSHRHISTLSRTLPAIFIYKNINQSKQISIVFTLSHIFMDSIPGGVWWS